MRDFGTKPYHFYNDKLIPLSTSCWSAIFRFNHNESQLGKENFKELTQYGKVITSCLAIDGVNLCKTPVLLYIDSYKDPLTEKYIPTLIKLINRITPCSIVKHNDIEYISYKFLSTYDQNLVLLNFIRNLWYKPANYNTVKFFEGLSNSKYKTAMMILTDANIKACKECNNIITNHSNALKPDLLKIKKSSDLLKYQGDTVKGFLTT